MLEATAAAAAATANEPNPSLQFRRTLFEVHFGPAEAAAQAVQGLARLADREAETRKHGFFPRLFSFSSSSFFPR